jgi:hypothetical protein
MISALRLTPRRCSHLFVLATGLALILTKPADAFVTPSSKQTCKVAAATHGRSHLVMSESTQQGGYKPPGQEQSAIRKTKALLPKIGDIVRYFDIDGGKEDGEVLVGKISYIQQQIGKKEWIAELNELEDVGEGYYAEYSSRQRSWKKTMRPLAEISPIAASFVRSENAFKIPRESGTQRPVVRQQSYDLDGYAGPVPGVLNDNLVASDLVKYGDLKASLLRNAALAGVFGTFVAQLAKGTEDAVIYGLGAAAGVFYLYFLTVKTDTMGSAEAKLGKNISNIRFAAPLIVFVLVAFFNKSLGDASPVADSSSIFTLVTPEQYGAAVLGFLTYRIPLFGGQVAEFMKDSNDELVLPGSAGMALKLAKAEATEKVGDKNLDRTQGLTPILLVSGPPATGRSELVQTLIREGAGRFVAPVMVDRIADGATFERMEQRGDFIYIDESGRYGMTRDSILKAATRGESVAIVDADVALAKKLSTISSARLIGVWVGLDSVGKFQTRLERMVDSGEIPIPDGETRESVVRGKIRDIVRDIEYGIVSGVFEFTILNEDDESSLMQLKTAAEYSFK